MSKRSTIYITIENILVMGIYANVNQYNAENNVTDDFGDFEYNGELRNR
jgi:hypothetical protein